MTWTRARNLTAAPRLFVCVYAEELHRAMMGPVGRLEQRHLGLAREAPRRPEIDDERFPVECGQGHRALGREQFGERKRGCRAVGPVDERVGHGAVAARQDGVYAGSSDDGQCHQGNGQQPAPYGPAPYAPSAASLAVTVLGAAGARKSHPTCHTNTQRAGRGPKTPRLIRPVPGSLLQRTAVVPGSMTKVATGMPRDHRAGDYQRRPSPASAISWAGDFQGRPSLKPSTWRGRTS